MYVNLFSGVALMTKYCHKKPTCSIWNYMVSMATNHANLKNEGAWGI